MSAPSADDWEALLRRFMAVDNADRKRAEALFAELRQSQPDATLAGLLQVVHSPRGDDVRGLAAVLLRRVLLSDAVSLWPDASELTQRHVKATLLAILTTEQDRSIRRKVCDTVGELASSILEDGQWDDLLPTLLRWSQDAASVTLRETALRVLEMIAIYLASLLESGEDDAAMEATIFATLLRALQDTQGRVALNAVRALSMLLLNLESPARDLQRPELLTTTVPLVLAELHRLLNAHQFNDVMELLEVLIEVAEPHAAYFKPLLRDVVDTLVAMADRAALPDGCRQLAMELLVSLAEHSAGACRRLPKNHFIHAVVPVTFRMMLELDDLDTWSATACDEADEFSHEISNFDVGSEALERLVGAIGAAKSLPRCLAEIQAFAARGDSWLHRHAALVGLCQVLEVLDKGAQLDGIVRHLLAQCRDPHPRVCCTAIDVIGQLAMDQAPHFQDAYHAPALEVLLHYLSQRAQPRLQAHAATALRQFVDMCAPSLLAPYLEELLTHLFQALSESESETVQEQTLTAVSSVATVAGAAFAPYYAAVMPTLRVTLAQCLQRSPVALSLAGITLECISLIGVAVGQPLFAADAEEVMRLMAQLQQTAGVVQHEAIRTYLLQAWARLASCLGQGFASYLPVVMPSLLHAAAQQAEFEIDPTTDSDSDSGSDISSSEDIQLAQVNDKTVSIRTSLLEEKATACQLLAGMVGDLEAAFFPYAEQVTHVLAPLATDSVHADIRAAAIAALPALVKCVALAQAQAHSGALAQMVDFALGRLVHALASEPEVELVLSIMQSMKSCIDNAMGRHQLNELQLREVVHALLVVLGDSFQRRAVKRAQRAVGSEEEEDEYEEEEEEEEDEEDLEPEVQFVMADCVGHLAKTHGPLFAPVFHAMLWDKLVELSAAHCLAEDRKLALYMLDDVIEHCGAPQTDVYLPLLVNVLRTSEGYAPLVQAAAFGLGLLARLGGGSFAPHAAATLALLREVLALPHAQDEGMVNASDNAVSAVGVILLEHGASVGEDAAEMTRQWLAMLPLAGDLEESAHVLSRLCAYVREGNAALAPHAMAVVRVLAQALAMQRAFARALGGEAVDAMQAQVADALARIKAALPAREMAQAWASLSGPQQQALHALFAE